MLNLGIIRSTWYFQFKWWSNCRPRNFLFIASSVTFHRKQYLYHIVVNYDTNFIIYVLSRFWTNMLRVSICLY